LSSIDTPCRMRKYDPVRDFFKKKRSDIIGQINLMLALKHKCRFPFGVYNITKSDAFTFFRHCRELRYLLRWHEVYRRKRVLDFGAGIGAAYHGLRFCEPTELVALEPNADNCDFIEKHFAYDNIIKKCWQEHDFQDCDVVFIRNGAIEDWSQLADKLYSAGVEEIVLIEHFVNTDDHTIYSADWLVGDTWTPGRFTHDRLIQRCFIPSIGNIRGVFYEIGYDLMNENVLAFPGHIGLGYFSLHYKRRTKPINVNDREFKFIADKMKKKQYAMIEKNKGNKS